MIKRRLEKKLEKLIRTTFTKDEVTKEKVKEKVILSEKFDSLDLVYFEEVFDQLGEMEFLEDESVVSNLLERKRERTESKEEGEITV